MGLDLCRLSPRITVVNKIGKIEIVYDGVFVTEIYYGTDDHGASSSVHFEQTSQSIKSVPSRQPKSLRASLSSLFIDSRRNSATSWV